MSPLRANRLLVVLAAALAASTYAQAARTREEVRAELADTRHSGDVIATGEAGLTLRELYPQSYPAAAASHTTRQQVIAELKEAQRAGDIVAAGELGLPRNELNPGAYPPKVAVAPKTRAEVQAELREAIRTGAIPADGETGLTLHELYPQRYTGISPMASAPMHATSSTSAMMR